MSKNEKRNDFNNIVQDILSDPAVQSMGDIQQHSKNMNCLNHSISVAYMSYLICRRLDLDYVAAARAGLLHDFHLCNWDEMEAGERRKRLWKHPHKALENANERYDLSSKEQDIIVKHMWPLTRPLPKHKESFVVSCADKMCAILEMSRLYKAFSMHKELTPVPSV